MWKDHQITFISSKQTELRPLLNFQVCSTLENEENMKHYCDFLVVQFLMKKQQQAYRGQIQQTYLVLAIWISPQPEAYHDMLLPWLITFFPFKWLELTVNFFLVMEALIADSPTVPSLLTEYILKGENRYYCQAICLIIIISVPPSTT